jgi:hypothetical protein
MFSGHIGGVECSSRAIEEIFSQHAQRFVLLVEQIGDAPEEHELLV